MARPCDTCLNYNKSIDEFRQSFVDVEIVNDNSLEQHFCPMYDDHIPHDIYHKGADCPYYIKK